MPAQPSPPDRTPIEVEQKYRLNNVTELEQRLAQLGAQEGGVEHHCDTYYRHPSRDFAQTREALRIRRVSVDGAAPAERGRGDSVRTLVTYKGPYSPAGVKSRPELEWRIDPCDPEGDNLAQLLRYLGLSEILTVRKTRRSFDFRSDNRPLTVTIDDTLALGMFAEVETIAEDQADTAACGALVAATAERLGLREIEKRSYLQMAIQAANATDHP